MTEMIEIIWSFIMTEVIQLLWIMQLLREMSEWWDYLFSFLSEWGRIR